MLVHDTLRDAVVANLRVKYPKRDHAGRLSVWMLDASAPAIPHQPRAPARGQRALVDTAKPTLKRVMETQRTYRSQNCFGSQESGGTWQGSQSDNTVSAGEAPVEGCEWSPQAGPCI